MTWMNRDSRTTQARAMFRCITPKDCATETLCKDNCGACGLNGHGDHSEAEHGYIAPNYSGWARIYVEARKQIPERYLSAFGSDIARADAYGKALRADVRTFGVTFEEDSDG